MVADDLRRYQISNAFERRSRFAQINASWAIEGMIVDEADLAMQERIIRGEITAEEAIDELKDRYAIR